MTTAEAKRYEDSPDPRVRAEARRVLDARAAARSRRRSRPERAKGQSQAERRAERNARAAEIRAAVMERAGENCEWCGRSGFVLEWAHIFGGGLRRAREAVDTTAAACADCHHRGWHGSGMRRVIALRNAKEWAARLGFRVALAEIDRLLTKAEAPSVPVRLEVRNG